MRVVVIGAYGVFGSRLLELLKRDGHDLWAAGRDRRWTEDCAARFGAQSLHVDLAVDLSPILAAAPQVVVDAAGPYQFYGSDPYKVARFCVDNGIHYLDLSDDADFTAGIGALDAQAIAAGCFVLSGASSVPGLSSAAVRALADGLDEIVLIETAILPGNRIPRGKAVMASILDQVGRRSKTWRGGMWRDTRCWTDRRRYRLMDGPVRGAWFIRVPDIQLFPRFFAARSVMFRAGMELPALNLGIATLALLRRWRLLPDGRRIAAPARWLAGLLEPFGTDRGGMVVHVVGGVVGTEGDRPVRRRWELLADAGSGPFIPTVAVRTLLRHADRIRPGARPCLAETTLAEMEAATSDLPVTTRRQAEPWPTLFQRALGETWRELPPAVRRLHSVQDVETFSGLARVDRGKNALARFAAWFFRFPFEGDGVPLTITKTRTASGETWERRFAGRVFRSYLTPARQPGRFRERFWLFNYEQDLPVAGGVLHLPVRRGWVLGVPIPKALLPWSDSRELEIDGVFHFDVTLGAPLGGGVIVRYRGSVTPDAPDPEPLDATGRG